MPTWLVTGGAGFIGGNFVLEAVRQGIRVVNLDVLTYAGNLDTLQSINDDANHVLRPATSATPHWSRVSCASTVPRRSSTPPQRATSTGPSTVRRRSCRPTSSARYAARDGARYWKARAIRAGLVPLPARVDRRGLRDAGRRRAVHRTTRYAPNSPYSASKAASDHLVRAFHHTYGLPVLTTNCSNNYGPYQFPEKLIPLVIAKALAGNRCRSTATAATCATGCSSTTTARPSPGAGHAAVSARPTTSAATTSREHRRGQDDLRAAR